MIKKHFVYLILVPFLMAFLGMAFPSNANADEAHYQNLIITKYGLSEDDEEFFGVEKDAENFLKINNIPLNSDGFRLAPLKDVTYTIQAIEPKQQQGSISINDPNSYILTGTVYEVTTNERGIAQLTLKDGVYLLKEQANSSIGLTEPAAPSLLHLPVVNNEGTNYLEDVYIYPKSKAENETAPTPIEQQPPKETEEPGQEDRLDGVLPRLGNSSLLASLISGIGVFLLLIWFGLRKESE